jgi:hypothetical protein
MADAPLLDIANRFDGAVIWSTLTPEQQLDIGAAALNLVVAWKLQDSAYEGGAAGSDSIVTIGDTADETCIDDLIRAFEAAVVEGSVETPSGQIRIPVTVGMICEACGCTEDRACEGGCGWARDNLCTGCVSTAPPSAPSN